MSSAIKRSLHVWSALASCLISPPAFGEETASSTADETRVAGSMESQEPPEPARDGLKIRQREAVRAALEKNPSLKAVVAERERAKYAVQGEDHRYQTIFSAEGGYSESRTPRLLNDNSVSSNFTRSWTLSTGLRRTFSFGTEVDVGLEEEYFQNSVGGGLVNPVLSQGDGFGTTASISVTQPLLRGAGDKCGQSELRLARADLSEAEKAGERSASQLIRDTLVAYAELWYATRALEIEQASMKLALQQEREANANVRVGALAHAEALSFSTQVAERSESVLAAEAELQNRTITLQGLIGEGQEHVLIADGEPELLDVPSESSLRQAFEEHSVELSELRARLQAAKVRAEVAGGERRPRLDIQGSLSSTGLGTDPGSALSRTADFQWVTGQVNVIFEAPVSSARKDAERSEALMAVIVAQENLEAERMRIRGEVRQAEVGIRTAERYLELAQRTCTIAEETLGAEQKRFRTGTGLSIQIKEADDVVRRARLREARARVDLAQERVHLQHLAGSLVRQLQLDALL